MKKYRVNADIPISIKQFLQGYAVENGFVKLRYLLLESLVYNYSEQKLQVENDELLELSRLPASKNGFVYTLPQVFYDFIHQNAETNFRSSKKEFTIFILSLYKNLSENRISLSAQSFDLLANTTDEDLLKLRKSGMLELFYFLKLKNRISERSANFSDIKALTPKRVLDDNFFTEFNSLSNMNLHINSNTGNLLWN